MTCCIQHMDLSRLVDLAITGFSQHWHITHLCDQNNLVYLTLLKYVIIILNLVSHVVYLMSCLVSDAVHYSLYVFLHNCSFLGISLKSAGN